MAAYNWPEGHKRRAKVDRFIERFAEVLPELQDASNGYHEKWGSISLEQEIVGWQRHDTVTKIISGQITNARVE